MSADITAQIETLRRAVDALRGHGVEILNAAASLRGAPSIHVVSPGPIPQAARYVRCMFDSSAHYSVPYMGCEVVWIDPAPTPGQPPADLNTYTPCERPHHV